MSDKKVIIADDDPDILDVLRITLGEAYQVVTAADGEEALKLVFTEMPSLVILDNIMPKMTGVDVCRAIKKDVLLRHLPVILVTAKSETPDKVRGLDAGADDYVVKPFDPEELLARVRMVLRRSEIDLDANPLTRLPGNVSIHHELEERIRRQDNFAVCYIDLDQFKIYNDCYGFNRGDDVIRETARILLRTSQEVGEQAYFVGHIGGDDFVMIVPPERSEDICQRIIREFDKSIPSFYNQEDRQRGFLEGVDRGGKKIQVPLMTISIGIVMNREGRLKHVAEVGEIGATLKEQAKKLQRSNYVVDRRSGKSEGMS